jgi:hypothetical protein
MDCHHMVANRAVRLEPDIEALYFKPSWLSPTSERGTSRGAHEGQ